MSDSKILDGNTFDPRQYKYNAETGELEKITMPKAQDIVSRIQSQIKQLDNPKQIYNKLILLLSPKIDTIKRDNSDANGTIIDEDYVSSFVLGKTDKIIPTEVLRIIELEMSNLKNTQRIELLSELIIEFDKLSKIDIGEDEGIDAMFDKTPIVKPGEVIVEPDALDFLGAPAPIEAGSTITEKASQVFKLITDSLEFLASDLEAKNIYLKALLQILEKKQTLDDIQIDLKKDIATFIRDIEKEAEGISINEDKIEYYKSIINLIKKETGEDVISNQTLEKPSVANVGVTADLLANAVITSEQGPSQEKITNIAKGIIESVEVAMKLTLNDDEVKVIYEEVLKLLEVESIEDLIVAKKSELEKLNDNDPKASRLRNIIMFLNSIVSEENSIGVANRSQLVEEIKRLLQERLRIAVPMDKERKSEINAIAETEFNRLLGYADFKTLANIQILNQVKDYCDSVLGAGITYASMQRLNETLMSRTSEEKISIISQVLGLINLADELKIVEIVDKDKFATKVIELFKAYIQEKIDQLPKAPSLTHAEWETLQNKPVSIISNSIEQTTPAPSLKAELMSTIKLNEYDFDLQKRGLKPVDWKVDKNNVTYEQVIVFLPKLQNYSQIDLTHPFSSVVKTLAIIYKEGLPYLKIDKIEGKGKSEELPIQIVENKLSLVANRFSRLFGNPSKEELNTYLSNILNLDNIRVVIAKDLQKSNLAKQGITVIKEEDPIPTEVSILESTENSFYPVAFLKRKSKIQDSNYTYRIMSIRGGNISNIKIEAKTNEVVVVRLEDFFGAARAITDIELAQIKSFIDNNRSTKVLLDIGSLNIDEQTYALFQDNIICTRDYLLDRLDAVLNLNGIDIYFNKGNKQLNRKIISKEGKYVDVWTYKIKDNIDIIILPNSANQLNGRNLVILGFAINGEYIDASEVNFQEQSIRIGDQDISYNSTDGIKYRVNDSSEITYTLINGYLLSGKGKMDNDLTIYKPVQPKIDNIEGKACFYNEDRMEFILRDTNTGVRTYYFPVVVQGYELVNFLTGVKPNTINDLPKEKYSEDENGFLVFDNDSSLEHYSKTKPTKSKYMFYSLDGTDPAILEKIINVINNKNPHLKEVIFKFLTNEMLVTLREKILPYIFNRIKFTGQETSVLDSDVLNFFIKGPLNDNVSGTNVRISQIGSSYIPNFISGPSMQWSRIYIKEKDEGRLFTRYYVSPPLLFRGRYVKIVAALTNESDGIYNFQFSGIMDAEEVNSEVASVKFLDNIQRIEDRVYSDFEQVLEPSS